MPCKNNEEKFRTIVTFGHKEHINRLQYQVNTKVIEFDVRNNSNIRNSWNKGNKYTRVSIKKSSLDNTM